MKSILLSICFCFGTQMLSAQWSGQSSSTDLTSAIFRSGNVMTTGMFNNDGINAAQIRLNSSGTYYGNIGNPSAQVWSLGWGTGGSSFNSVFSWTSSGTVGIGTTTPAYKFHIAAPDASVQQRFERTNSSTGIADVGVDNNGLNFFVGGYASPALKVLLGMNGNVGIGTLAPTAKLHFVGTGSPWTSSGWGKTIEIPNASVLKWAANGNGYRFGMGQTTDGLYFIRSTSDDNSAAASYDLFISNSGNIGIGTSGPDARLAVSGLVHATEVKVSVAVPGPDYVFEKNYKLLSLAEIKTYIDRHKHLPEVPSATEMEKNGVQLGEMNMLLLKKVEELTLYLLEIKKENEELKTRVSRIEELKEKQK